MPANQDLSQQDSKIQKISNIRIVIHAYQNSCSQDFMAISGVTTFYDAKKRSKHRQMRLDAKCDFMKLGLEILQLFAIRVDRSQKEFH